MVHLLLKKKSPSIYTNVLTILHVSVYTFVNFKK